MAASPVKSTMKSQLPISVIPFSCKTINPKELVEKLLHSQSEVFIMDCRPTLAYNSIHISGALGINLNPMMTKRLKAGKLSLEDVVIPKDQGKKLFLSNCPIVIYDECTDEISITGPANTLHVVLKSLLDQGKVPYLLAGGLAVFSKLYPKLIDVCGESESPRPAVNCASPPSVTPGACEDVLAWQTAPPVRILSYLVIGNEKDAASLECLHHFNITHVLNVTEKCPNFFEERPGIKYLRVPASDTGRMRLLDYFENANLFIDEARKQNTSILVHCMAGISRSVTISLAHLMKEYNMTMQAAYDFVQKLRPSISPNLSFMGQLLEYERMLDLGNEKHSPEILAMDPLSKALKESLKPEYMQPQSQLEKTRQLVKEGELPLRQQSTPSTSSFKSQTSTSSTHSGYGGVAHSTSSEGLSSSGVFTGSGLSASYSGKSAFVLQKPIRKKRTQSEADCSVKITKQKMEKINRKTLSQRNSPKEKRKVEGSNTSSEQVSAAKD